jgi:hypothetical protein
MDVQLLDVMRDENIKNPGDAFSEWLSQRATAKILGLTSAGGNSLVPNIRDRAESGAIALPLDKLRFQPLPK